MQGRISLRECSDGRQLETPSQSGEDDLLTIGLLSLLRLMSSLGYENT